MKYYLLFISFFISLNFYSQTIESILNKDCTVKDSSISEIVEFTTYKTTSKFDIRKRVYEYRNGFLIKRTQWDNEGKLSWRNSYNYDSLNNLFSVKSEKWNHSLGYNFDITQYNYDRSDVVKIVFKNMKGELESYSTVQNKDGLPVQITSFYPNNEKIGYETANYDLESNRVLISTFNKEGVQIGFTRDLVFNDTIEKNKEYSSNKYNEIGDLIQFFSRKCYSCDDYSVFQYEYKYDKRNNWIKQTKYILEQNKRKKLQVVKRNIFYRN